MRKWRPYLVFWILHFILESYVEYIWIRNSLAGESHFEILRVVILTELAFNFARIPTAVILSQIVSQEMSASGLRILKFLITFLMGIIAYRLIGIFIVLQGLYHQDWTEITFFGLSSINSAAINMILCSVPFISYIQHRKAKESKRKEEMLQKQSLENELKFLKAQINPHFLFNTLNNLYGLARNQDSRTPEVILKLADLMRFMLYESNTKSIPIETELEVLEKYLSIEKIRYSERLTVSVKKNISDNSYSIAPLLIIHLVENAFKHGISESTRQAFVLIEVSQSEGTCKVVIENTKAEVEKSFNQKKIGLRNIQRQLDLLYEGHKLDIEDSTNTFTVKLLLPYSL
ncbi:MAG: sensor histidine kinase [Ekhidna sp.]|nr:sensor histidine kinase [Ekhidna sp.]